MNIRINELTNGIKRANNYRLRHDLPELLTDWIIEETAAIGEE